MTTECDTFDSHVNGFTPGLLSHCAKEPTSTSSQVPSTQDNATTFTQHAKYLAGVYRDADSASPSLSPVTGPRARSRSHDANTFNQHVQHLTGFAPLEPDPGSAHSGEIDSLPRDKLLKAGIPFLSIPSSPVRVKENRGKIGTETVQGRSDEVPRGSGSEQDSKDSKESFHSACES